MQNNSMVTVKHKKVQFNIIIKQCCLVMSPNTEFTGQVKHTEDMLAAL